jgi:hypothetical protein
VESLGKRENRKAEREDSTQKAKVEERLGMKGRRGYLQGMAGAIAANSGEWIGRWDSAGVIQGRWRNR